MRSPGPIRPPGPGIIRKVRLHEEKLKKEVQDTINDLMQEVEAESPKAHDADHGRKKTIVSWFRSR
jgi:hypothetical protein